MQRLWVGAALALALAGCQSKQEGTHAERTNMDTNTDGGAGARITLVPWIRAPDGGSILLSAPYSGYPGPVGPSGTSLANEGRAAPIDAGEAAITPPSTAMPGARPFYPPDAGAR
jgi:hypothetical protein